MSGNGIGWAVKELQDGRCVRRSGWNGKNMWLVLVTAQNWNTGLTHPIFLTFQHPELGNISNSDWVAMKTADNKIVPWLCSQSDLLAIDWESVSFSKETRDVV